MDALRVCFQTKTEEGGIAGEPPSDDAHDAGLPANDPEAVQEGEEKKKGMRRVYQVCQYVCMCTRVWVCLQMCVWGVWGRLNHLTHHRVDGCGVCAYVQCAHEVVTWRMMTG
jgi:hypothetical protein